MDRDKNYEPRKETETEKTYQYNELFSSNTATWCRRSDVKRAKSHADLYMYIYVLYFCVTKYVTSTPIEMEHIQMAIFLFRDTLVSTCKFRHINSMKKKEFLGYFTYFFFQIARSAYNF